MSKVNTSLVVKPKKRKSAIERQMDVVNAQNQQLKVERDFWAEQCRVLQNQLQTVMRGQGVLLEQMARSTVLPDDVHAAIAEMGQQLRQPLTTVAAVEALAASCRHGTQGQYTAVNARKRTVLQQQG